MLHKASWMPNNSIRGLRPIDPNNSVQHATTIICGTLIQESPSLTLANGDRKDACHCEMPNKNDVLNGFKCIQMVSPVTSEYQFVCVQVDRLPTPANKMA